MTHKTKSLFLASGEVFEGVSFGADTDLDGEVVFTTGMAGYLEILTDPSYYGQIVVFTFPLLGNYGAFDKDAFIESIDKTYESEKIWVKGIVVTETSEEFSHCLGTSSFGAWLTANNIPAICGTDTRAITQVLRESGCILGALANQKPEKFEDPLAGRYVPEVSPQEVSILEPENPNGKVIAFMDCGAKNAIFRNFLKRGVRVIRCPFDTDPFAWSTANNVNFDGIFFSNGPGDPETVTETIAIAKQALQMELPIFGICLGNQMLGLAAGAQTVKMKYGHRGVNQPVGEPKADYTKENPTYGKCIITSQNHGYEVDAESLPDDFEVWFRNLNDQSVEGIRHKTKPICSVQFHPEACAGPEDAEYLFDAFISEL